MFLFIKGFNPCPPPGNDQGIYSYRIGSHPQGSPLRGHITFIKLIHNIGPVNVGWTNKQVIITARSPPGCRIPTPLVLCRSIILIVFQFPKLVPVKKKSGYRKSPFPTGVSPSVLVDQPQSGPAVTTDHHIEVSRASDASDWVSRLFMCFGLLRRPLIRSC